MGVFLTESQLSILQAASTSTWLSNSSRQYGSDIMRLTGGRLADDKSHLHLFVPEKYTTCFFKNLEEDKKVSYLFACVYTFTAFQIKGIYVQHRHCTNEENLYQKSYVEGFAKTMASIGIKSGESFKHYWEQPALCFIIEPLEIYEQTPKSGTGNKIN